MTAASVCVTTAGQASIATAALAHARANPPMNRSAVAVESACAGNASVPILELQVKGVRDVQPAETPAVQPGADKY